MTPPWLLPEGDERHDKALAAGHDHVMQERAGGVHRPLVRSDVDVIVGRYLASLAEQGARFVEVKQVAEWLRDRHYPAAGFLHRFGGGDEG